LFGVNFDIYILARRGLAMHGEAGLGVARQGKARILNRRTNNVNN